MKKIIHEISDLFESIKDVGLYTTFLAYITLIRLYLPRTFRPFNYLVRWNAFMMFKEVFLSRDYYFKNLREESVIFDTGGNIGISSMFFRKMYPKSSITVFEPDPKTRGVLKSNVEKLDIKIEPYALSDKDGLVRFYSSSKNPGGSSAYPKQSQISEFEEIEVETHRLSSYINQSIDLLKMDIEGAEGLVIKELEQSGKLHYIQNIALEYHLSSDNKLSDIINILEKSGMRISFGKSIFDKRRFFDSYFILRGSRI